MNLFFGFLGALLLGALLVGWYLLHRRITGEGSPLAGRREAGHDGATELEAFIAAYRAGKVSPEQLKSPSAGSQSAAAAPGAATTPSLFLRPEVKLAYLTFRTALRDHHVFANVRLSDVVANGGDIRVDLLVLDAKFVPVAAVDVYRPGEDARADTLLALSPSGVRYIRLQTNAMPRPGDIHSLLYRA
jgi:hypothetical protein